MSAPRPIKAIQDNIARVIKGKDHVIEMAVVCLLARGHLLLEDVPGVGKTTLAHSLARSLDCSFKPGLPLARRPDRGAEPADDVAGR